MNTKQTKPATIHQLVWDIRYQLPIGATTFSPCANECGQVARGGHQCVACLQKALAALTSDERAAAFVEAATDARNAEAALFET